MVEGSRVQSLNTVESNRARDLIESFMIVANTTTARFLAVRGVASIRRVVRSPERWDRIVDVAARYGGRLPSTPDVHALQAFLKDRRAAAPDDFSDLSLSVIKLLGRGEYVAEQPGGPETQHFALATSNYTHSTAPNRRFPDLITQRLIKATLQSAPPPYPLAELSALAEHCTRQEDAANKVERQVRKAAAALWLSDQIGERFDAVVTGASPKGTWVRLTKPPVEGRLERGVRRPRRRRSRARAVDQHEPAAGVHRFREGVGVLGARDPALGVCGRGADGRPPVEDGRTGRRPPREARKASGGGAPRALRNAGLAPTTDHHAASSSNEG